MLISEGDVQFGSKNKTLNKFGKHFIFVSKEIDIKVNYYYSTWVVQMLIFDISPVIRGGVQLILRSMRKTHHFRKRKFTRVLRLSIFSCQFEMVKLIITY